jgi:glycosyl hydrolase family 26
MLCGILFAVSVYAAPISVPPPGKLYHGFFYDGPALNEHDVRPQEVARYEAALGRKTAWIYFSDNWFESRKFPRSWCEWIRDLGKVPYLRLMLRSDAEQNRTEKIFTLEKINRGEFDDDLRHWAREAKAFSSPLLIEWGTEPNGDWFSWNGKWNGGAKTGPSRYTAAYRHIVDLMRAEGADNLQWVWHVNWFDSPEVNWNRFENYYPGDNYCDWIGLSAYGPLTPMTHDGTENLRFKMSEAYPRLTKLAPGKPIVLAEFGCDLHNRHVGAPVWAKSALDDLFSGRWPAIMGFCWWNEAWENDDSPKHNTDMNILHDSGLTNVFQTEFARHGEKIQESPISSRR